jgi:hypothetical protein
MLRTDSVSQYVMSEDFPAIDHRPSEEYTEIELPGPDAKERCIHSPLYMNLPNLTLNCPTQMLTDVRYLHERFSVLNLIPSVHTPPF